MKKIKILILSLVLINYSCLDDLNTEPEIEKTLENLLKDNPNAIKGALAKLYSTFSVHGQGAPDTDQQNDTNTDDSGTSPFLRGYWNFQELTADLVKNGWNDDGLLPLTRTIGWSSNNRLFTFYYDRINFTVISANNFINDVKKINPQDSDAYISEARFIRAFALYQAMDCFGRFGLIDETTAINGPAPKEASRTELFSYIEKELLDIETKIPQVNEYGRANKVAVQMLLAKIYLNAEVYIGQSKYTECLTQLNKFIDGTQYSLASNYLLNTSGNNFKSPELIWTWNADRNFTQGYGNTTYIINGSFRPDNANVTYGVTADNSGAWSGHKCTKSLYNLFGGSVTDVRARLFQNQPPFTLEINDITLFTNGYPTTKFRNAYTDGSNSTPTKFSDVDFPVFRLADAYLMYAESVLRGGTGGSLVKALEYINKIRVRANVDVLPNSSLLTLNYILDERARELFYEGHRRQDLIRFGRFTGAVYSWPWKGGVQLGTSIPNNYNVFPIPSTALDANPNLKQNPGF